MNITIIRSNPVDPDSRVEKEAKALKEAGYKVKILAWDRKKNYKLRQEELMLDNYKINIYRKGIKATYGGGLNNLIPLLKFQVTILKFLMRNRKNIDIVHACDFDTAISAFIFCTCYRKKMVYDIFDYYVDAFTVPQIIKKQIEYIDHFIINKVDAVIICTEKRKEQIKGTNPKKLCIIHNTPPQIKVDFGIKEINKDRVKVVYVGILSQNRFLKEMAECISTHSEYELHIGGFGEYETYFEQMALKFNNIKFYGKISYKEALTLENSCDLMVAIYNPTIKNHFYAAPNKFYEALMLGKPLIMAENTGMDEVINKFNIGGVIKYKKEEFEKCLENLVDNNDTWENMKAIMQKLYKEKYSWEVMEQRLLDLYKSF